MTGGASLIRATIPPLAHPAPILEGSIVKKICDECGKEFDIFEEGHGHALFVACGECWTRELNKRGVNK